MNEWRKSRKTWLIPLAALTITLMLGTSCVMRVNLPDEPATQEKQVLTQAMKRPERPKAPSLPKFSKEFWRVVPKADADTLIKFGSDYVIYQKEVGERW